MRKTTVPTSPGRERAGHGAREAGIGLICRFIGRELPLTNPMDGHMGNLGADERVTQLARRTAIAAAAAATYLWQRLQGLARRGVWPRDLQRADWRSD
jgi:hypothetical protein